MSQAAIDRDIQVLREMREHQRGLNGNGLSNAPGGSSFDPPASPPPPPAIIQPGFELGVIYSHGPAGEAAYTDERYFVRRSIIDRDNSNTGSPATSTTHITTGFRDITPSFITATNLGELYMDKEASGLASGTFGQIDAYQSGTHLLPNGLHVQLWHQHDARGNVRWFFNHKPNYWVSIREWAGGNGSYYGHLLGGYPVSTPTASNNGFSGALTPGGAYDTLIFVHWESAIPAAQSCVGVIAPCTPLYRKSDENLHVVFLHGFRPKRCGT